jgi:hypothetical protein
VATGAARWVRRLRPRGLSGHDEVTASRRPDVLEQLNPAELVALRPTRHMRMASLPPPVAAPSHTNGSFLTFWSHGRSGGCSVLNNWLPLMDCDPFGSRPAWGRAARIAVPLVPQLPAAHPAHSGHSDPSSVVVSPGRRGACSLGAPAVGSPPMTIPAAGHWVRSVAPSDPNWK